MPDNQQFLRELDKKLWTAVDKLGSNLDAAVYQHALLGLIFLKYVSDAFQIREQEVEAQLREEGSDYFLDPADYDGDEACAEEIRQELEVRDESLDAKDILGHVYEYFLGQFALAEGKKGGQYYTPKSIVSLVVEMLEPFKGRVYDLAMGSGWLEKVRNAETLRTQSSGPGIYSALSASLRFKSLPIGGCV